jgi:hypothetical protein
MHWQSEARRQMSTEMNQPIKHMNATKKLQNKSYKQTHNHNKPTYTPQWPDKDTDKQINYQSYKQTNKHTKVQMN